MGYNKPITFAERMKIEALVKTDLSLTEIASKINRSKNGVVEEVRKNGGRELYDAVAAHERTENLKKERYAALSEKNKGKAVQVVSNASRIEDLEKQIEILNMQIEILVDQLTQTKE